MWDSKQAIREGAVSALKACLILTTQRETKEMQKPQWYKVRIETPLNVFKRVHLCVIWVWALTYSMRFVVINSKHLRKPRRVLMRLAKEKGMNKDDRVHGALLILNELVRISSMEGEVRYCSCYRQQDTWLVRFCLYFHCFALLLCSIFCLLFMLFICLMFYLDYVIILLFVL